MRIYLMKFLFNSLLILTIVLTTGCSKEKQPENVPAPVTEPPVLNKEIQTLHKAEDLKQSASQDITEEHKKIEAATQ